jgi:hypothetical protein
MVASFEFCELSAFIHTHCVPLPAGAGFDREIPADPLIASQ